MAHNDPTQARFGDARRAAPDRHASTDHYAGEDNADAGGRSGSDSFTDQAGAAEASASRLDGASELDTEATTATQGTSSSNTRVNGDVAGRGKLVMAAKVVEKIAAQAASEVSAAGGTTGGVLGIGAKADLSARPKVEVHLTGRTATVDVAVAVAYPTSIRKATDRVRRHIIDRVDTLTGVQVTRVDIDVTALRFTNDTPTEGLR